MKLTWASMSFMESLASASPSPNTRKSLSNLMWRNGSVIPAISYSGEYGLFARSLRVLTKPSVHFCNNCSQNVLLQITTKAFKNHGSNCRVLHIQMQLEVNFWYGDTIKLHVWTLLICLYSSPEYIIFVPKRLACKN